MLDEELIADILYFLNCFDNYGSEGYTAEFKQSLITTIEELEAYVR